MQMKRSELAGRKFMVEMGPDNVKKMNSTPQAPTTPTAGSTSEQESSPYSRKIAQLAAQPKHRGAFFTEDATSKNLALITAKFKDIKIYWMVDPHSDLIYDAKFFSYGGPVSVAMGEALSSLVKGMKVETAQGLRIDQLEEMLRDEADKPAVVGDKQLAFGSLPGLLDQVNEVYPPAKALSLASIQMRESNAPKPRQTGFAELTAADSEWLERDKEEQIKLIDEVLTRDVRPGLNMDGGDMQILDLEAGTKLLVKYEGACGGCGSATGATLAFIEDTLRREIYREMQVVPLP